MLDYFNMTELKLDISELRGQCVYLHVETYQVLALQLFLGTNCCLHTNIVKEQHYKETRCRL